MFPLVINRDPDFWSTIGAHPTVRPSLLWLDPQEFGLLATHQSVTPLATRHGGFMLTRLDPMGRGYDLHAMYLPEGRGREVYAAGIEMLNLIFQHAQYITVHEVEKNPSSRPPITAGFIPCGPMWPTPLGSMRTWILTANRWWASPIYRRQSCHLQ